MIKFIPHCHGLFSLVVRLAGARWQLPSSSSSLTVLLKGVSDYPSQTSQEGFVGIPVLRLLMPPSILFMLRLFIDFMMSGYIKKTGGTEGINLALVDGIAVPGRRAGHAAEMGCWDKGSVDLEQGKGAIGEAGSRVRAGRSRFGRTDGQAKSVNAKALGVQEERERSRGWMRRQDGV